MFLDCTAPVHPLNHETRTTADIGHASPAHHLKIKEYHKMSFFGEIKRDEITSFHGIHEGDFPAAI